MATRSHNTFGTEAELSVGGRTYQIHRLDALPGTDRLPYSLKVLLENMIRHEDGISVKPADIEALAAWEADAQPSTEIAFAPARILMQDFTGVPAVVDLAAMRDAMVDLGGDPSRVNPLIPAELVIDHSIIADVYGTPDAFARNAELEFQRNEERYRFLRWGQGAFESLRVVPPNTGICHQVNLEYLARVVFTTEADGGGPAQAYPDTLLGTDSHTTMINGLGVLGWGVGGIEAEAAMLGQPVSMLIPRVVGFKLTGTLPEGATATDLVLTVTEMLRRHGVVGKFVEFYGEGVASIPLANRATIGNMSPEYGSTCAIFPIDDETLRYLELTGRPAERIALVEAYAKEQGLWHDPAHEPQYSERLTPRPVNCGSFPGRPRPAPGSGPPRPGPAGLPPICDQGPGQGRRRVAPYEPHSGDPGRRDHLRPRPRPRRHRGHHLMHQHVEPLRHGGRRVARQEGGGEGAHVQAVGEDDVGPGLEGGHGLLRAGRVDAVSGKAGLRPGRLRLHHLHRQQRTAPPAPSRTRSRQETWRWSRCCRETATSKAASAPTCG